MQPLKAKASIADIHAYQTGPFISTILREYDMRGIVGDTLTINNAYTLGLCFGTLLREQGGKTIATCYDGRLTSPDLHAALTQGLAETGCDIKAVGMGPTPLLYFAGHHLQTDAAIMVTGSHNAAHYNGFKMVLRNKPFYGAAIQDLGARAIDKHWKVSRDIGTLENITIDDAYLARLMVEATHMRPLKVVWDAGNGAAGPLLQALTAQLPGTHILLHADVDGRFPNHHPDPTVDANMVDLQKAVLAHKADLGIAFDGDGDRIGAVDEQGRIIRCDALLALYATEVLQNHPGATVIGDIKCSADLFKAIAASGGTPIMWKTGHSLIKSKMTETGAPLAGELSGHIFFADRFYGHDDALYGALRLLGIVSAGSVPLSALLTHMPARAGTAELRIDVPEAGKFTLMERIKSKLSKAFEGTGATLSTIDGIRMDWNNGWMLMRASNTQNCLVARLEADSPATLALYRTQLSGILSSEGLKLPLEG